MSPDCYGAYGRTLVAELHPAGLPRPVDHRSPFIRNSRAFIRFPTAVAAVPPTVHPGGAYMKTLTMGVIVMLLLAGGLAAQSPEDIRTVAADMFAALTGDTE